MITKTIPAELSLVTPVNSDSFTFVISHERADLSGDIIVQKGIQPVNDRLPAQVDHSGKMADVIGHWENLRTNQDHTIAELMLVPEGVSRMADLVRNLSKSGIKLAASIGFTSNDWEAIKPRGIRYNKTLLHEISVVVVPCQPLALQVAKSMGFEVDEFASVIGQALNESQQRAINRAAVAVQRAEALCHEIVKRANQGFANRSRNGER